MTANFLKKNYFEKKSTYLYKIFIGKSHVPKPILGMDKPLFKVTNSIQVSILKFTNSLVYDFAIINNASI